MASMQLVIVDDSTALIESIAIYGEAMGWRVTSSDGTAVPEIEQHLPTLVLLDYRLGNAKPQDWLQRFKKTYPDLNGRIFLLSGQASSDDLRGFRLEHHIDGILTKPLVLDRLTTLLGDTAPSSRPQRTQTGDALLIAAHNDLPAAFRVLDAATLEPLYENPSAGNYPLDDAARKTVQMMAHRLEQAGARRHSHLECDNDRWSLYHIVLAGDWYLLTQELMPKPDQFFTATKFAKRMSRLAEHLEFSYGITRLRFYRLAGLYSDKRFLLQPDWQMGGGFHPDETAWKQNEVLDTNVQKDLSAENWLISEVSPGGIDPEWNIGWGDATHRVTVPVRNPDDNHPVALLALDRRRDHLPPENQIARDDPWPRGIDEPGMRRMSGWLELCKPMLADHVEEHLKDHLSQWHEELSTIIQEGIGETEAREALTRILNRFQESWERGGEHIRDLYLLRVRDDDLLEAWAGTGPIWDVIRKGQLFEADEPYKRAFERTDAIHDFREWYGRQSQDYRRRAEKVFGSPVTSDSPPGALEGLGSCMGVPLKQGKRTFAMLAICVTPAHYFTEVRVKVLEESAARLLPVFLWGLAQAQRDWLRRALAHEYREPVNRLSQIIARLPNSDRKAATALLDYQSAIVRIYIS